MTTALPVDFPARAERTIWAGAMPPRELRNQKRQPKRLTAQPVFKPLKRNRLPKPFKTMGGARLFATDLIEVSSSHQLIFVWRDGPILTDRAFYGWLLKKVSDSSLFPLLEMHWHPSHKGLHIKTPCRTEIDYTNRQLPGAPELGMRTVLRYDPRSESDRLALIGRFCEAAGIEFGAEGALW